MAKMFSVIVALMFCLSLPSIIRLKGSVTAQNLFRRTCDVDTWDGEIENCSEHDSNLICLDPGDGTVAVCNCKLGMLFNPESITCDLEIAPVMNITKLRFSDCGFTIVFDGSVSKYSIIAPEYYWFCALTKEDLPTSPIQDYDGGSECFRKALFPVDVRQEIVLLKSTDFCQYGSYHIRLMLYESGRNVLAYTDAQLDVINTFKPEIDITCQEKCTGDMNPSQIRVYKVNCHNCHDPSTKANMEYVWTIVNSAQTIDEVVPQGNTRELLSLKADTLLFDTTYTFQVKAILHGPGSTDATATLVFQTTRGVSMGTCTVDPLNGQAGITKFTVSCMNFNDRLGGDTLHYRLEASTHTGHVQLVRRSSGPAMNDLSFPIGNTNDAFMVKLLMRVCTLGQYSICVTADLPSVTVVLAVIPVDTLLANLISTDIANDLQGAIQETLVTSSVLNSQSNEKTADSEADRMERSQVREQIIKVINEIEQDSVDTLQQVVSVMFEVTHEQGELSDNSLSVGIKVVSDLSTQMNLFEYAAPAQVRQIGKSLVTVVSNLMAQVIQTHVDKASNETTATENTEINQRNLTMILLSALDSVKVALSSRKVSGEAATSFQTDDFSLKMERLNKEYLRGHSIQVDAHGSNDGSTNLETTKFMLPMTFDVPAEDIYAYKSEIADVLDLEAVEFEDNPYSWSQSAETVTTKVSQLQLKRGNAIVDIQKLPEPIKIIMQQERKPLDVLPVPIFENSTSYIDFNKTTNQSIMLVFMEGQEGEWPELVALRFRLFNFTFDSGALTDSELSPVYSSEFTLGSEQKMLVPDITAAGSYLLGLSSIDYVTNTSVTNLTLKIFISQIQCLYWSVKLDEWTSEGCTVGPESTPYEIVCYCDHLTSFAGGFFVMPNKLNLKEDIAKFATFWTNPIGITVVAMVLVMYGLFVFFARRKDGIDSTTGAVVNLADNDPSYDFTYVVCVQTGSRRNSGSTANIVCVLFGDNGPSEPHILFSSSNPMCQKGSMDQFVIRTRYSLGTIIQLRFWHDNTGNAPEWFVSYCQVIDPQSGEMYNFVCNCWLAESLGENLTDRSFAVATQAEQQNLEFLFFTNASIALKNHHVWFSTYAHQLDSNFNTVQRVSVCLGLFMTYMLCNIMFYGIEPDPGTDQKMDLGPTSITWTELRIGMMSALIIFPVNVLIMTIFMYVRPRHLRNLYHVHPDTLKLYLTMSSPADSHASLLEAGLDQSRMLFFGTRRTLTSDSTLLHFNAVYPNTPNNLSASDESFHQTELHNVTSATFIAPVNDDGTAKKPWQLCNDFECALPWWFVYIAWFVLVVMVVGSGFFTILYTFNYGLEVSMKWLTSLVLTFSTDALIAQPVKVLAIAAIFSILFKVTLVESRTMNVNIEHTEFKGFKTYMTRGELRRTINAYTPPRQKFRPALQKDDERVYTLFYDIIRYLAFLYLVLLVTFGRQDINQFHINTFIKEQVIALEDMQEVASLGDVWDYINEALLEGIYDQVDPPFINNHVSLRLMRPLLVQKRKKHCNFKTNHWLALMEIHGRHWLCAKHDLDDQNYGVGWDDSETATLLPPPHWIYNETYKGYVVELGTSYEDASLLLNELMDNLWLNRYTAYLQIKMVLYTPQLNLLSLLTLTFEVNDPVGINPQMDLASVKLYRSTHSFGIFVLILEVLYMVYSLYFAIHVIKSVIKNGWFYFTGIWSFIDMTVVVISLNVVIAYALYTVVVEMSVTAYQSTGSVELFNTLVVLNYYLQYTLGLLVCCAMLKFLHMLRFNPIIYRFLEILDRAKTELMMCLFCFFVLLVQYSSIMMIVSAGKLWAFYSFSESIISLSTSLLDEFDTKSLQAIHPVLGPATMLSFLILGSVLGMNILISILMSTLTQVFEEDLPYREAHLLALLLDRVLQWLGIKKPHIEEEEEEEEETEIKTEIANTS